MSNILEFRSRQSNFSPQLKPLITAAWDLGLIASVQAIGEQYEVVFADKHCSKMRISANDLRYQLNGMLVGYCIAKDL